MKDLLEVAAGLLGKENGSQKDERNHRVREDRLNDVPLN
jgi:hypothetical protein